MIYYSRPIWRTDGRPRWSLPSWATAFWDDRTLAQMGTPGNNEGDRAGQAFYIGPDDPGQVNDRQAVPLGDLDTVLTPQQKTLLNVSGVNTLRQALLVKSVFGETPPELRRGGFIEIGLNGRKVRAPMGPGETGWAQVRTRMKNAILDAPAGIRGKIITKKLRSLGLEVTREKAIEFLDLDIEPVKPTTTKGDTFVSVVDQAINLHTPTGPNAGTSWTMLNGSTLNVFSSGNIAYTNSGFNEARLNDDMSSADHETEMNVSFSTSLTNQYVGCMTRKDSTATRTFMAGFIAIDRTPDVYVISKCVTGTYTDLTTTATGTLSASTYYNLRFRSDGNDHTIWRDDVQVLTVSDSSVTSGLRGGISVGSASGTAQTTMQVFLVTDEITPPATGNPWYYYLMNA